jgi:hypothetical protein
LEAWCRYAYQSKDQAIEILQLESFPDIDSFMSDRYSFKIAYHDYYLFSKEKRSTQYISIVDEFGARNTPDSQQDNPNVTIWTFGGSTMENVDTTDTLSIANQIAKHLNSEGKKVKVVNYGTVAFFLSLESIKFQDLLRRKPQSEWPNYVIFYDGYNEANTSFTSDANNLQYDLSGKLAYLITGNHAKLCLYSASSLAAQYSAFYKKFVHEHMERCLIPPALNHDGETNLANTVRGYATNVSMLQAICKQAKITPVFLFQPMVFTKQNLTEYEKKVIGGFSEKYLQYCKSLYKQVATSQAANEDFYDLSAILNDSTHNDFWDLGHTGPYTGITIGRQIAGILKKKMER